MKPFKPLLAYPIDEIDPQMDTNRDEGEPRLARVRALLISATRTPGLGELLVAESKTGLASLLSARGSGNASERSAVLHSIMACKSLNAPTCCLVAPSVRVLQVPEADALDECTRAMCIPIRRSDQLALPGEAPRSGGGANGREQIVVTWPRAAFSGATHPARLIIQRTSESSVRLTVENCTKHRAGAVFANDIPLPILTKLFSHLPATSTIKAEFVPPCRLPKAANELPDCLQTRLAAIAQDKLRLHVLVSAAAPEHTSRPLAFENMRLFSLKDSTRCKHPRMCVKAYLHPSSSSCVCSAHNLSPIQKRVPSQRFTGKSEVVISFDMCGEPLDSSTKFGGQCQIRGSGGKCPLHGIHNTAGHDLVPGLCCANCSVSLHCKHETVQGDTPSNTDGLWIPFDAIGRHTWLELTTVMAAVIQYEHKARHLFGKAAPPDAKARLARLVVHTEMEINKKVQELNRRALAVERRTTDDDLLLMDMCAVDLLREGGISQAKRAQPDSAPRIISCHKGDDLSPEEKKIAKHHYNLFPRYGQPCPKRKEREWDNANANAMPPSASRGPSPTPSETLSEKRPAGYNYEEMTEFMDPAGLVEMRRQIDALMRDPALPEEQRERGFFFQRVLNAMDSEYGDEVDGPLGLPARPLKCKYRARNNGGRLYPYEMAQVQDRKKGEARSVCLQGAPREMRPFLCCRWGHDFDIKNAQPEMLCQMAKLLDWPDKREPPDVPQLESWCNNRDEFIDHVAEVHGMPPDENRWFEYRKDSVKNLMIRLMFGGTYEEWIHAFLGQDKYVGPRSPRVMALAKELLTLRTAVFASNKWAAFYEADSERLRRAGKKKTKDEIDRSVFARIAQKTENDVLTVMRKFLAERGWTVLTLCFDGLIVQHRPERTFDLAAMNARILSDTGFRLEIVEKPLYSPEFPKLSLARS